MEAAEHSGLTVRGLPVAFRPVSKFMWVNVTHLSYGVPDEEITKALSGFGEIRQMKPEVYSNIYMGVRHVLMEIKQHIPFRIAGHWCFVHHKGQNRLSLHTGSPGGWGEHGEKRGGRGRRACHNPSAYRITPT